MSLWKTLHETAAVCYSYHVYLAIWETAWPLTVNEALHQLCHWEVYMFQAQLEVCWS